MRTIIITKNVENNNPKLVRTNENLFRHWQLLANIENH